MSYETTMTQMYYLSLYHSNRHNAIVAVGYDFVNCRHFLTTARQYGSSIEICNERIERQNMS